jgi:dynein assembly factor with WDR repeat domains 1
VFALATPNTTCSADGTARVYSSLTGECNHVLMGHDGEVSKVGFNPQGTRALTASSDQTARLWDMHTGECLQASSAE